MPDHRERSAPSDWVGRFLPETPDDHGRKAGWVLDLAAGNGRHTLLARSRGWQVLAVDRVAEPLAGLGDPGITVVEADLEAGDPHGALMEATSGRAFSAVIVTNYLYRPQLPFLARLLAPQGRLIYETFMHGNAAFGKPGNPDFLLQPNELFEAFAPALSIVAFEQGLVEAPAPRMIQRLCAFNGAPVLPG